MLTLSGRRLIALPFAAKNVAKQEFLITLSTVYTSDLQELVQHTMASLLAKYP